MRILKKIHRFTINPITIILLICAVFNSMEVHAVGLGSQGWGDSSGGAGDGGSGSLMSLIVAIGSVVISWWLTFSRKSPFKDNVLMQTISFLFGPAIGIMLFSLFK